METAPIDFGINVVNNVVHTVFQGILNNINDIMNDIIDKISQESSIFWTTMSCFVLWMTLSLMSNSFAIS